MVFSFLASRKDHTQGGCLDEKPTAVLHLLRRKGPPLSAKQLDYCNDACIRRLLKAKGGDARKAAKQLRATLAWRTGLDVDYLTADEFSAELAHGYAYVAGLDDEGRPVLIVRLRPEITTNLAQKRFIRYFVFTLEVAIAYMPAPVEQLVLIMDAAACHRRSLSGFSTIIQLLKLLGEHYPERLARSFIVDAPVFQYLWKGMGKFLDLRLRKKPKFVFSKHYDCARTRRPVHLTSATANHLMRAARSYSDRGLWQSGTESASDEEEEADQQKDNIYVIRSPQVSEVTSTSLPSLSFSVTLPSPSGFLFASSSLASSPSTFSVPTLSSSSLSPWNMLPSAASSPVRELVAYSVLSSAEPLSSSCSCTLSSPSMSSSLSSVSVPSSQHPSGGAKLSDKVHARSLSFASVPTCKEEPIIEFRSFRVDNGSTRRSNEDAASRRWADVGFGQRNEVSLSYNDHTLDSVHKGRSAAIFRSYFFNFLLPQYSEAAYRARMKPPLAGLISIISPDLKSNQPSFSLHSSAMEAMLHHLHFD